MVCRHVRRILELKNVQLAFECLCRDKDKWMLDSVPVENEWMRHFWDKRAIMQVCKLNLAGTLPEAESLNVSQLLCLGMLDW